MYLRMLKLQSDAAWMVLDASSVMAQRLGDLTDMSPAATGERVRMVTEKQTAFVAAGFDASTKLMHGAHPVVVMEAALRPIRKATRANRRRLAGRS